MEFSESARRLAAQASERQAHVQTEEAVKQALILPFLDVLGFDIYDPREVIPEYNAGWAKVSEKIDYALVVGGRVVLFVEAKGPHEVPANHDAQLAKYFNSTPEVKFAIITNGLQYRFFTDLQEPNILDKKPFFEFDLERFSDSDIAILERFRKDVFNVTSLISYAEELVYLSKLKDVFKRLLRDPSDDFTQFAIKSADLVDGRVTQRVVERFRPLVRDAISAAILEIVGQSFMTDPEIETHVAGTEMSPAPDSDGAQGPSGRARPVLTTEEELQAFDIIRCMLGEHVPKAAELTYRDSADGFFMQYACSNGWFARFLLHEREQKEVILRLPADRARQLAPDLEVRGVQSTRDRSRVYIRSLEDLSHLRSALIEAVQGVVA